MEQNTLISTNRLFHYTPENKYLKSILQSGFQPRYSLEKLGLFENNQTMDAIADFLDEEPQPKENITDEFGIPMTCFCDIPLELVTNHTEIYGKYALGLTKQWGEVQNITPVFYVPAESDSRFIFEQLARATQKLNPKLHDEYEQLRQQAASPENEDKQAFSAELINFVDATIDLIRYVKPYKGNYKHNGYENKNHKYYDEREWRYVPHRNLALSFLSKADCLNDEVRNIHNDLMGFVTFNKNDLTDIIVPENEVDEIRDFVSKQPHLSGLDLSKIDTLQNKLSK